MNKGQRLEDYDDAREVANFIAHNGQHLMSATDYLGVRALLIEAQAQVSSPSMAGALRKRYQPKDEPIVQYALDKGWDGFTSEVAQRVLEDPRTSTFLNRCPACSRIPRTPRAMQCPWCYHSWRASPKVDSIQRND